MRVEEQAASEEGTLVGTPPPGINAPYPTDTDGDLHRSAPSPDPAGRPSPAPLPLFSARSRRLHILFAALSLVFLAVPLVFTGVITRDDKWEDYELAEKQTDRAVWTVTGLLAAAPFLHCLMSALAWWPGSLDRRSWLRLQAPHGTPLSLGIGWIAVGISLNFSGEYQGCELHCYSSGLTATCGWGALIAGSLALLVTVRHGLASRAPAPVVAGRSNLPTER